MRAALMPSLAKQRLPAVTEPKVRLHQVRRPRSDRPREPPPAKVSQSVGSPEISAHRIARACRAETS